MAQQRWGQRAGDRIHSATGLACLALVGCLILAACSAQARDPLEVVGGGGGGNDGGLGSGGGGGGGGGGGSGGNGGLGSGGGGTPTVPAELAGRWERSVILQVSGDLETITTTWTFDVAGSCERQVRTFSVVEGFAHTTRRPCRFQTGNSQIDISFTDTGGMVSFRFDFAGFSPDRLLLDGLEFQRVP